MPVAPCLPFVSLSYPYPCGIGFSKMVEFAFQLLSKNNEWKVFQYNTRSCMHLSLHDLLFYFWDRILIMLAWVSALMLLTPNELPVTF